MQILQNIAHPVLRKTERTHKDTGHKTSQLHKDRQHYYSNIHNPQHLHAPSSSSFSPAQSHEHMPPPLAPSQPGLIPSHSPSPATKLTQNSHPSKLPSQHKQISSRSLSPATKSFTQNSHPLSKPPQSSPQHKQTLSRPSPSSVQRNHLSPARQGHDEEWTKDRETSSDIIRSVQMIMTQLHRMGERQISIEKKIDENMKAIKQLSRDSAIRRSVKPEGIVFRTVDDFLAFDKIDEDKLTFIMIWWDTLFILDGPSKSIALHSIFAAYFPKEVSTYLTLNERTGPGGCKLRDSRVAETCQDVINANKYFPNLNKVQFNDALEKALKSLKIKKWCYNRKRRQASLHEESEEENEEVPLNQRRRMDNPEENTGFENIQEEAENANEPEETQHPEEENADDMDTQDTDGMEDNNEQEYLTENDLYDNESDEIVLFSSPPDCC